MASGDDISPFAVQVDDDGMQAENAHDTRNFHLIEAAASTINSKQNGPGAESTPWLAVEDDFLDEMRRSEINGASAGDHSTQTSDAEMNAISMSNLYDRDFQEMNTDKYSESSWCASEPFFNPMNDTGDSPPKPCNCNSTSPPKPVSNNNQRDCYFAPANPCGCGSVNNSLYFADGKRSIDFVLAWNPDEDESVERTNAKKREVFEANLVKEGLELERETLDNDLTFVKIHAPFEVLRRYSEILKLRMPMKEYAEDIQIPGFLGVRKTTNSVFNQLKCAWMHLLKYILVDEQNFPKRSHRFTAVYSRDKEYLFDLQQACFFTAAIRSRIVQFILDRKKFTLKPSDDFAFGIERLISEEVYLAAYPLHDGDIDAPGSMRYLLYSEWASIRRWYRYQPLDYVKEYFGVKIGLYFAWLGYYTYMLLLASIVGLICFIVSYLTLDQNRPSHDICKAPDDIKMCPLCDHWCDYWDLKETCIYSRITYLIDNPTTVFFAVFMSFWAALFLELWKRYSAEITHRWDLTGFDTYEEHPRPQYLARLANVKKVRIDYVTNTREPHPPFWRMKLPATVFSFSVVILLVLLALAAVLAVVLYRMSMLAALSVYGDKVTTSWALLFTTATAASINLCLIFVFNWMYTYLAEYLTELELLRTQTEFDDSLTLKIYLLQFVNYYASIFYIAFFKGKFIGHPGKYNRFLDYRQEECGFGSCLMELCIQLAIIMIGKQAMNSILEMIIPMFFKWLNVMRVRYFNRKTRSAKGKDERWLNDLKLVEWGSRSLFPEYLEMVLQYGFVTIFVAAFPLAPLFALLNNILEMRLDGRKLLTFHRRPVSQRVRDIGIWYRILDSIGKLSVITNGFIIAFTSDFVPRLVYRLAVSEDGSLAGYLNYTLAYFDTKDLQRGSEPVYSRQNVSICRYPDFREPPWSPNKYERTAMYWIIFAARLGFVVVFENVVAVVMIFVKWCIPDKSAKLRDQIRRETYITNEIIIKQEALRARSGKDSQDSQYYATVENEPNQEFIGTERLLTEQQLSESQLDLRNIADGGEPNTIFDRKRNFSNKSEDCPPAAV
ncbi:anoctamin-1 isoform X4 [Hermetia illucens]|uniref:anoctamin-1 isoform X4 n=1 Tax=Hermetia illucens TaxID=343691 RepID=UPI0018CBF352|nr:anoctamin-1 isoform X4 [Hermetia illucens]